MGTSFIVGKRILQQVKGLFWIREKKTSLSQKFILWQNKTHGLESFLIVKEDFTNLFCNKLEPQIFPKKATTTI